MMAELCFSVDDFIFDFFSNTVADTASEHDGYGHRRCWTAAASCAYYSCRQHAKPVGLVLPRVCCSRIRLEHKAQDSTSPALLRLQQQEKKVHDAAVF